MHAICFTHRGKKRTTNQDALLAGGRVAAGESMEACGRASLDAERSLFVVVDGMGGYEGGEVAAKIVVETLLDSLPPSLPSSKEDAEGEVRRALDDAARRMEAATREDMRLASMGTTLAGLWADDARAFVFNCGDCRVYRYRGRFLEKLSHDHSEVQELVDTGMIDEEEMRRHPRKNVVTSAVQAGGFPALFFREYRRVAGDAFLLCSDGVWEALSVDEMEECLGAPDTMAACEELRRRLLATDCGDNVSFVFATL